MTKTRLIEILADDIRRHGDGKVFLSLMGDSDSLELEDIQPMYFESLGLCLVSDIEKYHNGTEDFRKDIEIIDSWE